MTSYWFSRRHYITCHSQRMPVSPDDSPQTVRHAVVTLKGGVVWPRACCSYLGQPHCTHKLAAYINLVI